MYAMCDKCLLVNHIMSSSIAGILAYEVILKYTPAVADGRFVCALHRDSIIEVGGANLALKINDAF